MYTCIYNICERAHVCIYSRCVCVSLYFFTIINIIFLYTRLLNKCHPNKCHFNLITVIA